MPTERKRDGDGGSAVMHGGGGREDWRGGDRWLWGGLCWKHQD